MLSVMLSGDNAGEWGCLEGEQDVMSEDEQAWGRVSPGGRAQLWLDYGMGAWSREGHRARDEPEGATRHRMCCL